MSEDVERRIRESRYRIALNQALGIERIANAQIDSSAKKTYRELHEGWKQTAVGSPEEEAFENVMKPYEKTLEKKKLLE